jgi:hypothetical protein
MVNDIGTTEGRQVIDVDGGHATVVLVGGTAYIQGDATAVASYFDLPASQPAQLAGKWISLTPNDSDFSAVTSAVTLNSDFSQVGFKGPYTVGAAQTVGGRTVVPIHGYISGPTGSAPIPATLTVTSGGTVLPVTLRASSGQLSASSTWSQWGQAVALAAPPSPIPMSSIAG